MDGFSLALWVAEPRKHFIRQHPTLALNAETPRDRG
jgi:hypothetical protein